MEANKGKHLTISDREYIQDALSSQCALKEIADRLAKDPTTISKEIKRNRIFKQSNKAFSAGCTNRKSCQVKNLCSDKCKHLCKSCQVVNCYRVCTDYKEKQCTRLQKFPHVCNGCDSRLGCRLDKYDYRAKVAEVNYRENLVLPREGIGISKNDLEKLDLLISPLVKKGQSLAHIYAYHKDEIPCSERALYNYFEMNLFEARNIDLPRKVRYKSRKKRTTKDKQQAKCRQGRTYEDFQTFIKDNPETSVVEMDTVEGTKGGKVLLTLFFRSCSLMIAILMKDCTQDSVKNAIETIYSQIGHQAFKECFPVILTDNGSEFKDPNTLEHNEDGNERTKIFYCDALASHQKARIEKNHEYIRYVIPKGRSFDSLTQEKITLMMNHINSTARASRNGTTPFKLAQLLLNGALLESQSLFEVPPDEVHLKPALLK